jgi:hypothetical protein
VSHSLRKYVNFGGRFSLLCFIKIVINTGYEKEKLNRLVGMCGGRMKRF